jgi:hypothetical protein
VGWGVFETNGRSFDLSHLDESILTIEIDGEEFNILVEFSDHCFTEDAKPNDTRPAFKPCSRKDGRFCEKRYEATLNLRDCIERACLGSVWLGEEDRCIVVKLKAGTEGAQTLHYVVPFTLEKWKGDKRAKLKMRIRSAYLKASTDVLATFGIVKFAKLVELTVKGKKPQRNYQKNRKTPW